MFSKINLILAAAVAIGTASAATAGTHSFDRAADFWAPSVHEVFKSPEPRAQLIEGRNVGVALSLAERREFDRASDFWTPPVSRTPTPR